MTRAFTLSPWLAFACCVASSGCGESDSPATECSCRSPENPRLSYENAPIVYGSFDPPGTFMTSLSQAKPRQLNDIYDFYPIALSPGRGLVAQVTLDEDGAPRGAVVVTALQANGEELSRFATPGILLGWADDEHLLFEDAEGVSVVTRQGVEEKRLALPDWVVADPNGNYATPSPDGRAIAFIVASATEDGLFLLLLDGDSGAELEHWPVAMRSELAWAGDGHLVLTTERGFETVAIGDAELAGPFALPFQPCAPRAWPSPELIHWGELVVAGDSSYCANSWTVRTDGTELAQRDAPPPIAISPDRMRLLVAQDETLVVSTIAGTVLGPLAGVVSPHDATW